MELNVKNYDILKNSYIKSLYIDVLGLSDNLKHNHIDNMTIEDVYNNFDFLRMIFGCFKDLKRANVLCDVNDKITKMLNNENHVYSYDALTDDIKKYLKIIFK